MGARISHSTAGSSVTLLIPPGKGSWWPLGKRHLWTLLSEITSWSSRRLDLTRPLSVQTCSNSRVGFFRPRSPVRWARSVEGQHGGSHASGGWVPVPHYSQPDGVSFHQCASAL